MSRRAAKPSKVLARDDEVAAQVLRHWHEAVPGDRMAHLVKHAMRGFLRALQTQLAQHEVAIGHWTFLRILWEHDGLTQRELSIEAGVMEPTTLVALRSMVRLGYITREHRPGNRKNVHVLLTPLGRALREKLVPLAENVNAVALQNLDPADIAVTRHSLLTMIANLARSGEADVQ